MAGVAVQQFARRISFVAALAAGLSAVSPSARAVEALDGRVQFHGFTEMQVRALDEKFAEELDLAQWYNVLNLELEFDVAPDGIGPIDLLSAYVRVEGRYDAIYSNGFYMFPSVNTFGDDAENLPKRLRDGKDRDTGGVIRATDRFGDFKTSRIADRDPTTIVPPVTNIPPNIPFDPNGTIVPSGLAAQRPDGIQVAAGGPKELPLEGRRSTQGERRGFPGFDTFFRQAGPDDQFGTEDDPAVYVHDHVRDFAFTFKDVRGPIGADTAIMGPWLPKNFIRSIALNPDKGNPFRGRVAATPMGRHEIVSGFLDPLQRGAADPSAIRYHQGDLIVNPAALDDIVPIGGSLAVDILDPVLLRVLTAPDNVLLDLRGTPQFPGTVPLRLNNTFPGRVTFNPFAPNGMGFDPNTNLVDDFGGDFMGGIVPCLDPTDPTLAIQVRNGAAAANPESLCIESSSVLGDPVGSFTPPGLTDMTGGFSQVVFPLGGGAPIVVTNTGSHGETPFRPAPDLPNLGSHLIARDSNGDLVDLGPIEGQNEDFTQAQGLYVPSMATVNAKRSGDLDSLQFNYDEVDRSWNRGQSQENNKELKEAYLDVEVLDSRLWMRLGLQNIVWGKTELFRTTDQFNPQDLALASLPSLEESRIALWSARFVYSLYDVGPLEDVRLEFATNIDQYQPSDLGACGEPFTPDVVCQLTGGIFAHSLLGVGVVGIDRPESPWKEPSDLEIGGRIEWRWDRFSFALMDFWGFSDFPSPTAVFYYERNVDHDSGRPLVARLPGELPGTCGQFAGEGAPDALHGVGSYSSSFASHPFSVTTGVPIVNGNVVTNFRGGIGRDPDCLRPGGAPGGSNAFSFDTPEDDLANTNALEHHHANQQIFAWICAGTIGIAAALDAGSCAWTIFASDAVLQRQVLPVSFIESLTALMAGEQTGNAGPQRFMGLVANNTKEVIVGSRLTPTPLASLNMLFNNPQNPFDRNRDGDNTDTADCNDPTDLSNCDLGGYDGFDGRTQINGRVDTPNFDENLVSNFITLDRALTNEQRALLGCGPFYGSRCDSSLPFRNFNQGLNLGNYGGLDFMNMEASALVQSWPGVEGTQEGHTTTSLALQPGTVGWAATYVEEDGAFNGGIGGPICTRFRRDQKESLKLPGCRGVKSLEVIQSTTGPTVIVEFEAGYLPSIDGCVMGHRIRRGDGSLVGVSVQNSNPQLDDELARCSGALTKKVVPNRNFTDANMDGQPDVNPDGTPVFPLAEPSNCPSESIGVGAQNDPLRVCNALTVTLEELPLIHPVAGCVASPAHFEFNQPFPQDPAGAADCRFWMYRDLVEELFDGTAQLFQNELAGFSWNFLMFLTLTSCNIRSLDLDGNDHRINPTLPDNPTGGPRSLSGDPQCFTPDASYTAGRCSIASPQYCTNVKGFLSAAGVTRNTMLAGGNKRFGRRTFLWHSGGETVLDYEQRNVLGLSADFAEDVTKTNWGVEFTFIEDIPFQNNDSFVGLSNTDAFNLTVSVDRPTFINFLNPNRTFFFNSQWFFLYLNDWDDGYTFNGPWNVLFTFAMFTGYFQDRVQPQFVTVFDVRSASGGLLPSLQYRFTESFSVTIGMLYFFGHTQLKDMALADLAPAANRSGGDTYETGVDNLLSLVRKRDEVFLRLRWTF